ncbi:uncharacterized protein LOC111357037 isoform X2 [Spodoptera litura]|uniref:Uncharacterized protein LOC111357037 isoform X2 n=1 Tax=Spodoptera litura TaxID=69820 RepID=A0A9J7EER6_SPOLT|nr:uncharacterized protein LOC111357037 isoform X2 [Spodoptera litura]
MADIKSFIKKRASIKAKLTQFNSYLSVSKSCEKLSEVQIVEIEYRLNIFENLYEKYDALQDELEALVEDPSEQYAEREEFEKLYYSLVASARQLISGARKLLEGDSANEVDSCISSTHKHNSIRLPKIDLPKYSGSYRDWLEFSDTFVSIVHNNANLDKINKLHYLRASLKGSASLVIDNLDFNSENYDTAWKLLCDRYDNKRLLVNNHVQALFNVQSIDRETSKSLRYIFDTTNKNLRALATLGQPIQNCFVDVLIIYIMTSKLHHITNLKWEEHRNTFVEPPTLSAFINFLSNRADLLETMEESKPIAIAKSESVTTSNKAKTHSMLPERSLKALTCPMCRQDHFIFACEQFKSLSVQARIKKAQDSNVCMNCLRPGHDTSRCKLGHCKYCRQKHNTLLHIDNDNVLPSAHNTVLSATQSSSSRIILLSTALVRVTDADGNHQTARVLLDSGSTTNFISEDFVRKLHITTYITNTKVQNANINSLKRFHRIDVLKQHFWTRFAHEYIMWLQERTKWRRSSGELKEGTMVVIKDNNLPPLMWLLGRITHVLPGRDGVARVADILTKKGVIRRAFNTICPLPVSTVEDSSTGGVC